ncbi:Cytochrome p450 [Mycena venus]|uniref:Cytochrome p450 n=1 Tax=Mycena venus TaxID=2733690 RepID=A0A8H7DAT8_9AGAR|nr:Cytochrome p450 [Mycena venus]
MPSSPLQNAGLALISCVLYYLLRLRSRKLPLPPGPKGLPLLGNIYDVPEKQSWLAFLEMTKKYDSDIISLNLMGTTVVVLNSAASIQALLEDKSMIYSSRPPFPMVNDLVGYHWNFGFMPYGPKWKQYRKTLVQQFQPSQMHFHRPLQLKAARVLLQRLLETPAKFEKHLRHMAAGSDTTVSVLNSFILAMTLYPEIQEKAQAAVDHAVGQGRLPDFNDSIPYLDAVLREVLRWRPVVPLAIPHAVTEDDVYNGYYIPRGAVVLGNSWAVLHDEAIYGSTAGEFIPERWLNKDGEINTAMREPSAAFGFGRRSCPGREMAQWSVWICAASILAAFTISKSVDEKGSDP